MLANVTVPWPVHQFSNDTSVSYSNFPAKLLFSYVASEFGAPVESIPSNILYTSVFFETLNIEIQTTHSVFSLGAFLVDTGGDVGLCLGLSVISKLELGNWILKMVKNQDLIKKLKKVKDYKCPFWRRKHSIAVTLNDKSNAS